MFKQVRANSPNMHPDPGRSERRLAADCVAFLRSNGAIENLAFEMGGIAVWPDAYRLRLVAKIQLGGLVFVTDPTLLRTGAKASWSTVSAAPPMATVPRRWECISLRPGFCFARADDLQFIIHELTHAHIYDLALGMHSRWHNEAVAYVTQATWSLAQPATHRAPAPAPDSLIAAAASYIAARVLEGRTRVSLVDTLTLMHAIKHDPMYRGLSPAIVSGGRPWGHRTEIGEHSIRLNALLQ